MTAFIDKYHELKDHKINVFSTDIKKQIADELDMNDFNVLNVYIKSLKDKNAIRYVKGNYIFNSLLIRKENEDGVTFLWH
ncbi:MAG: hypothetical protein WD512_07260 [Candidatus Paceibacterota bacterium]